MPAGRQLALLPGEWSLAELPDPALVDGPAAVKEERAEYIKTWGKPGKGKYFKRQYNRACRRAAKGTGKTRAIGLAATEIGYGKHHPATGRPAGK